MSEIKEDQLSRYIHGSSKEEATRLHNQATTVSEYLHYDSVWDQGSKILEVGCGVGAQTEIIARKNRDCQIISAEILTENEVEKGISGLLRTAKEDGVFSYTFFKGKAER